MLQTTIKRIPLLALLLLVLCVFNNATCKYSFRDASPIPTEIKTFRVNYLENKAQFVNAQLSPQLTESLKRKIINITRLKQTNEDDAHYDISGYVSQYYPSTVNISNNTSSTNRLNIGFHLIFKNTLDPTKNFETDITRYEDFSAQLTLSDAENTLTPKIVTGIVDEIFNKIFSNW